MEKLPNNGNEISIIGKNDVKGLVWDDTRAFLAVARHGTLSMAARALNIGIATLSRRINRLEEALDVPLFVRHQTGYQLTEDGTDLIEKAEAIEAAALALSSGARQQAQLAGKVRLATAENLASGLIIPALPEFRSRHPGLMVEVVTDITTVNVHRRDADLALRMVKPQRGNVTLKRLGTLGYGLYASSDYVKARQVSTDRGSYEMDAFIAWGEMQAHLPAAQWVERVLRGRSPAIITTSLSTQVSAAAAGLGLAVLPHFLAKDANLTCIDTDIGIDQPIYLVIQSDLAQSRRTRALADFLSDLVVSSRARLRGY
ncbi:LysR family transcriptional regulator [Shimia marina]|uniref:HTH-type transcriptional activator AmpR n=1 Tax=Shimia marina TaxID=321267 RepID=A0A0P1F726_9RHOB|nr:LysR family transcriptional regulator [Shimia marina]CUH50809.1 HTH-type transcriptional activator AmpR [Shimia marina]SFE66471.1 transcriptional regulator, LysR family [Shimia marina]